MKNRLTTLRKQLTKQQLAGFIIPSNDQFMSEYVPPQAKRLTYITGFNGSFGIAVILKRKCAFFTDGRYMLQVKKQLDKEFEIFNIRSVTPSDWLRQHLSPQEPLGFDPWLHSAQSVETFRKAGILMTPVADNPIDAIWKDQPDAPASEIQVHAQEFAGEKSDSKRRSLAAELQERGIDATIITAPDSLCWLLNIRANDVEYTPFLLAFAIAYNDASVTVFVDESRISPIIKKSFGKAITFLPLEDLTKTLHACKKDVILLDRQVPYWFKATLEKANAIIKIGDDPCQLPKSIKNDTERQGMRNAHIRDGAALTRFICWLNTHKDIKKESELSAAEYLCSLRKEDPLFQQPSFNTISGFGPNGAIVHYAANNKTNRKFSKKGLYLVDSGGQYLDGTTDVTRTMLMGKTCNKEERLHYTLVLKGHINLAKSTFPKGTTGTHLDVLARQHLWEHGLDYDHGTGHGVGSYLCVHEGPQRISRVMNQVALKPGMIISNEPGYYKTGAYGIRIESLVEVIERKDISTATSTYYGFHTLTLAPFETRLIEYDLLSRGEKQWLKEYHDRVVETLTPLLDRKTLSWLKKTVKLPIKAL